MRFLSQRQELLEVAREISSARLVTGTWGNVSLRITNEPLMLITPSGMDYQTMTIEDLVLLDLEGAIVEGMWKPSVEYLMHAAIYQGRSDVGAVVHVHSAFATAFAAARRSIPVILEETAQVIGHEILTAPYAACGSKQLAAVAMETLGTGQAVLLANHGLVGVGPTIREALKVCYIAEETAKVALLAYSLGEISPLTPAEISKQRRAYSNYGQKKGS